MIKLSFYTQLIQTDLDCVSAEQVLQQVYRYPQIAVSRYRYFELHFDHSDKEKSTGILSQIQAQTFQFRNPTKEQVLNNLPEIDRDFQLRICVSDKEPDTFHDRLEFINRTFDANLTGIQSAIVWELRFADKIQEKDRLFFQETPLFYNPVLQVAQV